MESSGAIDPLKAGVRPRHGAYPSSCASQDGELDLSSLGLRGGPHELVGLDFARIDLLADAIAGLPAVLAS